MKINKENIRKKDRTATSMRHLAFTKNQSPNNLSHILNCIQYHAEQGHTECALNISDNIKTILIHLGYTIEDAHYKQFCLIKWE